MICVRWKRVLPKIPSSHSAMGEDALPEGKSLTWSTLSVKDFQMTTKKLTPPKKKIPVRIRETTYDDIPTLMALNRAAYPTLAEENVVWGEIPFAAVICGFSRRANWWRKPAGRSWARCASLIVDLGPDPLRHHTWAGITDSGYFTNHDPRGDTLYGADVYVHPDSRGLGVGHALVRSAPQLVPAPEQTANPRRRAVVELLASMPTKSLRRNTPNAWRPAKCATWC